MVCVFDCILSTKIPTGAHFIFPNPENLFSNPEKVMFASPRGGFLAIKQNAGIPATGSSGVDIP